jgi:acetyl esterase/lipase
MKIIKLWDNPPLANGTEDADTPTLTIYPVNGAKTAVMVCPGGGYEFLSMDNEGDQICKWFNERGITAFILKYRVAPYKFPVPMLDGQRGLRTIRHLAIEYGYDTDKIGVMGFSAGGHLSSTLSTHFDYGNLEATDNIERMSCRPDFTILCYAVISLLDYDYAGPSRKMPGDMPIKEVESLCNDRMVTANTPPAYLHHTADDTSVSYKHSIGYFTALNKMGVDAELHIYPHGAHGIALAKDNPELCHWPDSLHKWLINRGYCKGK